MDLDEDEIRVLFAEWALLLTALRGADYKVECMEERLDDGVMLVARATRRRDEEPRKGHA